MVIIDVDGIDNVEIDAVQVRDYFVRHRDNLAVRAILGGAKDFADLDVVEAVEEERMVWLKFSDSDEIEVFGRGDISDYFVSSWDFGQDASIAAELFGVVADDQDMSGRDVERVKDVSVGEGGAIGNDNIERR